MLADMTRSRCYLVFLAGGRVWLDEVVDDAEARQRDELEHGRAADLHAQHQQPQNCRQTTNTRSTNSVLYMYGCAHAHTGT